jgi:23S rRNA pseudouridine2605 synthase
MAGNALYELTRRIWAVRRRLPITGRPAAPEATSLMQYFMLNKPPGCICARRDFAERQTVYGHVQPHFPVLPHVGRLDYNSEGLLLFTDDGRLAQAMINSGYAGSADPATVAPIDKVYHVKIRAELAPDDPRLLRLAEPLRLPSGILTRPARLRVVGYRSRATWVEVAINEGRNRQVRRLCERSRLLIVKLRRVRFGPLVLGDLRLRWCRPLTSDEIAACYAQALPRDPVPDVEPIDDSAEAYVRAAAALARGNLAPTGGAADSSPD